MDNSMTTWIIVALLVLLIGAAIFMLLRRPGSDDSRDAPAMERDGARRDELEGRTAPEQAQAVAPDQPARDDAPFDQSSYDSGGATPVDRHDGVGSTHDERAVDAHPADDFLGVDTTDRDEVSTDPAFQDPRTEGHALAGDPTDHHADRHTDRDAADRDEAGYDARPDEAGDARPGDEGYAGAPASEGYRAAPASEGYAARSSDAQAYQEHPAGGEDREHHGPPAQGSHDGEPLTADEVLDSRGVADSDTGEGYAAAPVETDRVHADHDRADHDRGDHHRGDDRPADQSHTDLDHDSTRAAGAAGGGAAGAASATSAPSAPDEPVADQHPEEPSAGGAVFAESEFGPGSVEPAEDGSGPEGWEIKGNTGSMLFHTQESPSYDAVRAEVWFESEEAARAAGFAHWDRKQR